MEELIMMGKCTCITKSPNIDEHDKGCAYRILCDPSVSQEKKKLITYMHNAISEVTMALVVQANLETSDIVVESHLLGVIQDINTSFLMIAYGGYYEL